MPRQLRQAARLLVLTSLLFLIQACSGIDDAPTLDELKNASYSGIDMGDLTLSDGEWQGEPYLPDSHVAPRAGLVDDFYYVADLDDNHSNEAVALIWSHAGGTGSNSYLAVMDKHDGKVRNVATALVGDRVKIQSAEVADGKIVLHVLQVDEDDAMCCPTQLATRTWWLENSHLIEGEIALTGKVPAQ